MPFPPCPARRAVGMMTHELLRIELFFRSVLWGIFYSQRERRQSWGWSLGGGSFHFSASSHLTLMASSACTWVALRSGLFGRLGRTASSPSVLDVPSEPRRVSHVATLPRTSMNPHVAPTNGNDAALDGVLAAVFFAASAFSLARKRLRCSRGLWGDYGLVGRLVGQ